MTTAQQVVDLAKSQVGYQEGFSGGHWNNIEKYAAEVPGLEWANGQAWCDVFVCWVFTKAGLTNFPVAAYTGYSVAGWKQRGRWSEYPAIGAQVQFGRDTHTGICIAFDDTTIWTVEGNTNTNGSAEGDGVYLKTHRRTDPYVYGYGYPEYEGGIQSADPAWAHQNPGVTPAPAPAPAPAHAVVSLATLMDSIYRDGPAAQGTATHPEQVLPVEQALSAEGLLNPSLASDGSAGTSSFGPNSAYQRWQLRLGYKGTARGQAADGYPGITSLTALGNKYGFGVTA